MLSILNSGRIELLDHKRCIAQLIGLERRTTRLGKDTVSHAPGGHDDVANALAGAVFRTLGVPGPGLALWQIVKERYEASRPLILADKV